MTLALLWPHAWMVDTAVTSPSRPALRRSSAASLCKWHSWRPRARWKLGWCLNSVSHYHCQAATAWSTARRLPVRIVTENYVIIDFRSLVHCKEQSLASVNVNNKIAGKAENSKCLKKRWKNIATTYAVQETWKLRVNDKNWVEVLAVGSQ